MVPSAAFQAVCKEFDSLYPLQKFSSCLGQRSALISISTGSNLCIGTLSFINSIVNISLKCSLGVNLIETVKRQKEMDPVTALAMASTAFSAIKRGISIGNDIESMSSDISRWMSAIGTIREAEQKAKNPPLFKVFFASGSVEQEAIEAFSAKKKAQAMEAELRTFINFEYGPDAWNEILYMQAQIRKQRKEDQKNREEIKEKIWIWSLCIIIGLLIMGMIVFLFANI